MTRFAVSPNLSIRTQALGRAGEPLLIIDNFLADPSALIDAACASSDWRAMAPGGYPGQRTGLPAAYARAVLQRIDGVIRRRFWSTAHTLDHFDCAFSMVTHAAEDLGPLQRVPHIDIARPTRVAVLHYLCDARFGGTAFFRQDSTGLEQIAPADKRRYVHARTRDLEDLGGQGSYPNADTPGYTRTGFVEAAFNRLVIYRSFTLHSGIVDAPERLTDDPRTGRLTANFFVDYAESADPKG